jgi:Arc/MetJ-type ribon-helix-helix transcriptional regulator
MTTVSLIVKVPETLRRQAQAVAKLRGETVSEIVRTALRDYIKEALDEARDLRQLQAPDVRVDAGQEPHHGHDEVWTEIEALQLEKPKELL